MQNLPWVSCSQWLLRQLPSSSWFVLLRVGSVGAADGRGFQSAWIDNVETQQEGGTTEKGVESGSDSPEEGQVGPG